MRKIHLYITTLIALSLVTLFVACEKDEDIDLMTISVATEQATPSYTSATIQCRFATKATLRNVYVQYATTQDFAEYEEREMANVDGVYTVTLDKLLDNTVYYVRYAVSNRYSSAMVEEISTFKTLIPSVPSIVLDSITSVWDTYANVKIRLAFDGGAPIQEMGVCWGTQAAPVVENNKLTTNDTLAVLAIKDLQPNTKYHVRAYAVNKAGIAYSEEYELTTYALPEVKTEEVTDIQLTSALVSGTLVFNGNDTATVTGFCWGANEDPTLENEHAEVDTTSASYMYRLSNLKVETQYYVRAYAQNRIGVVYGEVKSFTTKSAVIPTVTTSTVTQISETTAVAGGNVTSDGGASVTERGVVYSTSANPTTANSKVASGSGTGAFTCNITGLQPNTTYYVRAYAVNSKGTSYGEEVTFNTLKPIVSPTVTTSTVSQIAETTAVAGGNVTSDGGASVTERGVVYSTSSNPTTASNKVASGSGTGAFTCNLTGLQPNTTYYVRAYAVNSKGTSYGEEVSFTTNEKVFATPEYVDLGLSVKWATFNVGATKPEEYGDYFAWGETEPKSTYDWSTYSEAANDVAAVKWGGSWRMPTQTEQDELRTQCTWTWTTQNGVKGYRVMGTNGNSIFLPAAGYRSGSSLYNKDSKGFYWSSTLYSGNENYAYYVSFTSNDVSWYSNDCCYGQSVRPVYGAQKEDPYNETYFSVSNTKKVTFSKGNLQYTQSTNTWSFAENQWDMIGVDNVKGGSITSDLTYGDSKAGTGLADKVDLFGWSTSANSFGVSRSTLDSDYRGSFVDWGTNKIGNDAPNTWRTLTYDEWEYLLNTRPNASSLNGVAQVNGVNGLIFLPDNWVCPAGVTFKSGFHSSDGVDYYAAYQTFTAAQWTKLEIAGAVFLPAAGYRSGSGVGGVRTYGFYYSATEHASSSAFGLGFISGGPSSGSSSRHYGQSVRLVKDL